MRGLLITDGSNALRGRSGAAARLTWSIAVSTVISGAVGLAIPRLLTPSDYGLFQNAQLDWQLATYVTFGII